MARVRSDRPRPPPAAEQPASAPPRRPRSGPDGFQEARSKPAPLTLESKPPPGESRAARARVLDPRLIPLVPPAATSDPARQYHALLGLPPRPKSAEATRFDLDALVESLSPSRARVVRAVLAGEESALKRALVVFLEEPGFRGLGFEEQRRALAAFDLKR